MSRINGFISRSVEKFQGAMQKLNSFRSNSQIKYHAAETVKRG